MANDKADLKSRLNLGEIVKEDVQVYFAPVTYTVKLIANLLRPSRGPKSPNP